MKLCIDYSTHPTTCTLNMPTFHQNRTNRAHEIKPISKTPNTTKTKSLQRIKRTQIPFSSRYFPKHAETKYKKKEGNQKQKDNYYF